MPRSRKPTRRSRRRQDTHQAASIPSSAVNPFQALADQSPQVAEAKRWQALADGRPEAQAQGLPPTAPTSSPPTEVVVQRTPKVGFELEDGSWLSWIEEGADPWWGRRRYYKTADDRRGVRPARRHEILHNGAGFNLEADAFNRNGEKWGDLEFVTDPFELTEAGRGALATALDEIGQIYGRLDGQVGRDHTAGRFVDSDAAGLNNNEALLSEGAVGGKLNLQATSGLSLEDIPKAFKAIGGGRMPLAPEAQQAHVEIQYGSVADRNAKDDVTLRPLREAPEAAFELSMRHLQFNIAAEHYEVIEDNFRPIYGLVTAAVAFIKAMHAGVVRGGAKTMLPMMHRNDFATMFGMLPDQVQTALRANEQVFADAIIAGVADTHHIDGSEFEAEGHRDMEVFKDFQVHGDQRNKLFGDVIAPHLEFGLVDGGGATAITYRALPPMTIDRWVRAWVNGDDPADLLTEAEVGTAATPEPAAEAGLPQALAALQARMPEAVREMIDWQASSIDAAGRRADLVFDYERLNDQQKAVIAFQLRGLGGLGADTDDAGGGAGERLALFENRALAPVDALLNNDPTEVPIDLAQVAILSYFRGMMRLLNPEQDR